MRNLLLTFDLEKFVVPDDLGRPFSEDHFSISINGLNSVLKLLNNHEVNSTFFTTLDFAERSPKQINEILDQGHELALHGKSHKNYSIMELDTVLKEIKYAKEELEDRFGCHILGFRAPRFKSVSNIILRKAGIFYDSSINSGRSDYYYEKILRIPVSVTPNLKLQLSWIWFRNFGLKYVKLCTKSCLLSRECVHIYFHPWDFADLSGYNFPFPFVRNTGDRCLSMLNEYLNWSENQGIKSKNIAQFIESIGGI